MHLAEPTLATQPSGFRGHHKTRRSRPPLFIWLPSVLIGAALLLPLVYLLVRTLGANQETWTLLFRTRTLEIVIRSLLLMVSVVTVSSLIAIPLAWLTTRTDLPFRRAWTILTILPLAIPTYVGGFLIIVVLGPKGSLQSILSPLGVERLPDIYGYPGALLTLVLLSYPYMLLIVRAALLKLDPSLEEASRSLGKGPWRTFWHSVLPQLRPAVAAGGLLVGLYALSDFGAVSLLRYETFTWAIYTQYQSAFDRTTAAALSFVLVMVAVLVLLAESRTRGQSRYHRSTVGVERPSMYVHLNKWRWPALVFCGLIVLLALAIPVAVLMYWAVQGILVGEPIRLMGTAALHSVYVSGLAAVFTVVAALPVVVFSVRYPSRLAALLESIGYVGFALPGIVIALALVFFGAKYAMPFYQTIGLLVFAYVVLFFPTAIGAARASLLQVSPQLEDAARGLGRKPWQVLRTVTLPIMMPGVLAGAGLVFLLTIKELPATLILSPLGFHTLATSIWSGASEAFFAQAAVPALLLILISSFFVGLLLWRERRSFA